MPIPKQHQDSLTNSVTTLRNSIEGARAEFAPTQTHPLLPPSPAGKAPRVSREKKQPEKAGKGKEGAREGGKLATKGEPKTEPKVLEDIHVSDPDNVSEHLKDEHLIPIIRGSVQQLAVILESPGDEISIKHQLSLNRSFNDDDNNVPPLSLTNFEFHDDKDHDEEDDEEFLEEEEIEDDEESQLSSRTDPDKDEPTKFDLDPEDLLPLFNPGSRIYIPPLKDIEKQNEGVLPNLNWPTPYIGAFNHLFEEEIDDITIEEAFLTTDVDNEDDCDERFSKEQVKYLETCDELAILPNLSFLKMSNDSSISLKFRSMNCLDVKAIVPLIMMNNNLEILDFGDNCLGPLGAQYVANAIVDNDKLKRLHLSGNAIKDQGCRYLMPVMSYIAILDISRNALTDKALQLITRGLRGNEFLEELNLSGNYLGMKPLRPPASFKKTIASLATLVKLNLGWNCFRLKQATLMLKGVASNLHLSYVDVSYNGLTNSNSVSIKKILTGCPKLTYFDVSANRITEKGAKMIARGIKLNSTLKTFKIGRNPIQHTGALLLLIAYSKNQSSSLKLLDLSFVCVKNKFLELFDKILADKLKLSEGNETNDGFKMVTVTRDRPIEMHLKDEKIWDRILTMPTLPKKKTPKKK